MTTRRQLSKRTHRFLALAVSAVTGLTVLLGPGSAQSARADTTESIWGGTSSTAWGLAGNWGGGLTSSTVSAEFNAAFTNQPTLGTTAATAQGIWVTGATASTTGVSGLVTIGGSTGVLTITGTATLDSVTNAGILLDGAGNSSLTISAPVTLTNSTNFTVNNTGTLTLQTGALNLGTTTLTLGGVANSNIVISSAMAATAGLVTVNTAGTVTLSGNNANTGQLTLTAGTLVASGSNTGTLGGAGTLSLGGGILDLQNSAATALTYTRATTVVTGNTQITSDRSTSSAAGDTYTFGGLTIGANTLTIVGASNVSSGTAGVTFGAVTATTGSPTFTVNNSTTGATTLLTLASITPANGETITFNGTGNASVTGIIGATTAAVTMAGSGTLTLSGANTFTGGLNLNSGTLVATVAGAFGANTNTLIFGGGNLELRAATTTYTGKIDLSGAGETITINPAASGNGVTHTISGAATLGTRTTVISAGSLTTTNTAYGLTLSGAASFNPANANTSPTFTINGNGTTGVGTLTLSGGFNTNGNTDTLTFNSGTGIGAAVVSGAFAGTAGTLELAGNIPTITVGSLTTTGNALKLSGSGTYTLSGTSTFTGGVILNNAAATYIVTAAGGLGSTSGKAKFNVAGATLDLRGTTVTYTSGIDTTANGGTITVEPATNIAGITNTLSLANTLGTNTLIVSPGALTTTGSAYGLTLSGSSALSGNPTFTINGNGSGAGTLTLSGGFDLQGTTRTLTFNGATSAAVVSGAFTAGTAGVLELTGSTPTVTVGSLTGTANAVQVSGTGTYTLNGTSTFTGGVILNSSSAIVIATTAGGLGSTSGKVKFNVAGTTLTLQNDAGTTFTSGLDTTANGGTIVVDRATNAATATTHTLSLADSLGGTTLTVSATGGHITSNTAYGLTLSGLATLSGNPTFTVNNNGSGLGTLTFNTGGIALGGSNRTMTLSGAGMVSLGGPLGSTTTGNTLSLVGTGNATLTGLNLATAGTGGLTNEVKTLLNGNTGNEVYTFSGTGTSTAGIELQRGVINLAATTGVTAGTLTLDGGTTIRSDTAATARTYANPLAINGNVTLGDAALNGALSFTSATQSNVGGNTVTLAGGNVSFTTGAMSLTAGTNMTFSSAGPTLTMSGGFNLNGGIDTLTLNTGSNAVTLSGALSNAGTLVLAGSGTNVSIGSLTTTASAIRVDGTGTYTFNGTSTFTGGVILNSSSAIVIATTAGGLGSTSGQVTFNTAGTTLDLKAAATSFTSGINTSTNGGTITVEPAASGPGVTQTMTLANTLGSQTLVLSPGTNVASGNIGLTLSGVTSFAAANTNAVFTINGPSGTGGNSTLTLSGGFTFKTASDTDTLTFNSGTVNGGTNSASISGAFTNAGILVLAGSAPVTIGTLTGTASAVQVSGTGTYLFNGASTFTGGLNILNGSTVKVGSATGVGSGTVTLGNSTSNGTLDLNGQSATIIGLASGSFTPAGDIIGNSSTSAAATVNYTGATTTTFGGVIQDVLGGGNKTTALTVNNASANLTLSGANTYSGLTTVTAGTLLLSGSNSSSGATTLNSSTTATLLLGTGTNGGLASGLLTILGTVASSDTNPRTIGNAITFTTGASTLGAAEGDTAHAGNLTFSNVGTMNSPAAGITVNNSTVVTLTNGSFTTNAFKKYGTGTMVLNNISMNVGSVAVNVNAGTLQVAGTTSLIGTNNSTLVVNNGGTLDLNGINAQTLSLSGTAGGLILNNKNDGSTSVFTIGAGTNSGATYAGSIIDNNNGGTVNSGTGKVAVIVNELSPAVTIFSGTNTYSGGTTINSTGTLSFANGSLGSGAITFGGSATLQWATGNTQDISANTISATTGNTETLDLQANNVTFATINGLTGSGNITKAAASSGVLTLNAANNLSGTYTAATTGGTTLLKDPNAFGGATVSLLTGITIGGVTFDSSVGSHAFTFGNLTGAGNLALQDNAAVAVALTVGGNNSSAAYSGNLSGTNGSLTKTGTGTLTLSGTNTYTGTTTVNAGTLQFAKPASLYNSTTASWTPTNIDVKSGATLAVNVGTGGTTDFAVTGTETNLAALISGLASSTASTGLESGSFLALDTTNASFTMATVIANTNGGANVIGLNKLGANTLTINATNSYTGPTLINGGTISFAVAANGGSNSSLGASGNAASNLIINGQLTYTGAAAGSTDRLFTIGAATILTGGNGLTFTNTGPIAFVTPDVARTLTLQNGVTLYSQITDNGSAKTGISDVADDSTVQLLSTTSNYTGNTSITGATRAKLVVMKLADAGSPSSIGSGLVSNLASSWVMSGADNGGSPVNGADSLKYIGTGDSTNRNFKVNYAYQYGVWFAVNASGTGAGGTGPGSGALAMTGSQTYSGIPYNASGTNNKQGGQGTYNSQGAGLELQGSSATNILNNYGVNIVDWTGPLSYFVFKEGSNTWLLSGNNAYTGTTWITAGILEFAKATAMPSSSPLKVVVSSGATLAFGVGLGGTTDFGSTASQANLTTALTNLLGSSTATTGLLNGSYIGFDTTNAAFSTSTAITNTNSGANTIGLVDMGPNNLTLSGANTFTGNVTVNANTLTLGGMVHTAGRPAALVNGPNLGNAAASSTVANLILNTTPTLVGTTVGGTTGINTGVKNTQIVPYFVGESGAGTTQTGTVTGTPNTFLTYNATTGLRPLNLADEFTLNATTTGNNIYITATTAGSNNAINSLVINGGSLTIATGVTVTNTSGALLFASANSISATGTGKLDFGSAEGMVTINSGISATISAPISGTGGLTVTGGTLTLSGNNANTGLSGGITLNGNTLIASSDSNFGAPSNSITLNGSSWQAGNNNYILNPQRSINVISSSNLTIGGSGTGLNLNIPGNIVGGSLRLYGNNAGVTYLLSGNNTSFANAQGLKADLFNAGGSGITASSLLNLFGSNSQSSTVPLTLQGSNSQSVTLSIIGTQLTTFYSHAFSISQMPFTFDIQDPNNTFTSAFANTENGTGQGNFTKSGAGTLDYTGTYNTTSNSLVAGGGTFKLDIAGGAVVSAGSSTPLTIGAGTFYLLGKTTTTNQTLGGLTINPGGGTLIVDSNTGGNVTTLTLGGLAINATTAGGTLNIVPLGTSPGVVKTSMTNDASGIIGAGRIVYNGTDWATVSGTTIGAYGTLSGAYTALTTGGSTDTNNSLVTDSQTISGTSTTNTVKVTDTTTAQSLTIGTSLTLTSAGLLFAAPNDYTITGGILAGTGKDLIITTGTAGTTLKINSVIDNSGANPVYTGTTATSAVVTGLSSTAGLYLGEAVTGSGVPASSYIKSIDSATQITLNAATTTGLVGTPLTFTVSNALTKAGVGTLDLTGSPGNTYTGVTYVDGGTVIVSANNQLGATAAAQVNLNGTLKVTTGFSTARPFAMGGSGGTFDIATGQTLTLSALITGGNVTVANSDNGTGILELAATGTAYQKSIFVNSGTLKLTSASAVSNLGYSSVTFNNLGGTTGAGNPGFTSHTTTQRLQLFNNSYTFTGLSTSGTTAATTDAIVENGGSTTNSTINVYNGADNVFAGVIRDNDGLGATKNLAFVKAGAGKLTLSGANTYTGGTTLSGGIVQLGVANALPNAGGGTTPATNGVLTLNGSIVAGGSFGTLDLNSFDQTVTGLASNNAGNVIIVPGTVTNNAAGIGTSTLTVNNDATTSNANFTFGGVILDGATAHVALTKTGSMTLTLTNTNTYTGTTTINGGTLFTDTAGINGSNPSNGIAFGGGTLAANTAGGITTSKAVTATATMLFDTTNGPITLNGSLAGGSNGLTLSAGSYTLTLNGTTGLGYTGPTTVSAGTLTVNGALASTAYAINGSLIVNGAIPTPVTLTGSGNVTLNGSGLTLDNGVAAAPTLTVTTNGGLVSINGTNVLGTIQSVAGLQSSYTGTTTVATGATLTANTIRQNILSVVGTGSVKLAESAGKLADGWPSGTDGAVSVIGNLTFDPTAKLDVTNNDLIITGMSVGTVESMVRNGYSNGAWDGSAASPVAGDAAFGKIVSTDAALRNIFTLLVMDSGSSVSSFDTVTGIPAHSVIVKFTHEADLNGDGYVTGTGANNDLALFASYYAAYNVDNGTSTQRAVTHAQGDMDFDGQLTFNDAMLFTNYYNEGLAHLPEPTSLAFLALGAAGLLARKRR